MSRAGTDTAWSAAELDVVRRLYPTTPVGEIAHQLGRSEDAVRHAAKRVGVKAARTWTTADDAALAAAWGKVRSQDLARTLKRSPSAIRQRAIKLGLDAGRQYTDAERALVRELYPTHTAAQIAERVLGTGKAAKAVYRLAFALGLSKQPHLPDEVLAAVRRECAAGGTDAAVARRLGLTREQVTHVRNRLGIPRDEAAVLAARRAGVKTQYARLGVRTAGELRALAYREFARENGWPEDLRPREVQILNALAARGVPMTAPELAAAIGANTAERHRTGKRRILLSGNGPGGTYTASLARRGLVVNLGRLAAVAGRGKGRSRCLFTLGPAALAILEERARCQTVTP